MPRPESFDPLPLTPAVFHILLALAGGDRHGYAIMREAQGSGFAMGPGTLYGSIRRLLEQRWIEETPSALPDEDERRRYYRITEPGTRALRAEAARLAALVERAADRGVLGHATTREAQ